MWFFICIISFVVIFCENFYKKIFWEQCELNQEKAKNIMVTQREFLNYRNIYIVQKTETNNSQWKKIWKQTRKQCQCETD